MKEKSKMITLPCDCKCCMFVVEKTMWEDGDINYNITICGCMVSGEEF